MDEKRITFGDIFKSSFLERVGSVTLLDMILALGLAFVIGLFIYLIYRKTFSGVMYSASFGLTLVALTLITTLIILAVTSNVVLSLGMVGALSIVRFRTAVKDPLDIAFLFWSISAGIVLAAGFIPLALFGSVLIGVVLLLFSRRGNPDRPYILVLHCLDEAAEKTAYSYIESNTRKQALKSKSVSPELIELNYEIRLQDSESSFVNQIAALPGVSHAVLVSYSGDYAG